MDEHVHFDAMHSEFSMDMVHWLSSSQSWFRASRTKIPFCKQIAHQIWRLTNQASFIIQGGGKFIFARAFSTNAIRFINWWALLIIITARVANISSTWKYHISFIPLVYCCEWKYFNGGNLHLRHALIVEFTKSKYPSEHLHFLSAPSPLHSELASCTHCWDSSQTVSKSLSSASD